MAKVELELITLPTYRFVCSRCGQDFWVHARFFPVPIGSDICKGCSARTVPDLSAKTVLDLQQEEQTDGKA
jgi:predicted nucleic acid-binding Zn ribbon protein